LSFFIEIIIHLKRIESSHVFHARTKRITKLDTFTAQYNPECSIYSYIIYLLKNINLNVGKKVVVFFPTEFSKFDQNFLFAYSYQGRVK